MGQASAATSSRAACPEQTPPRPGSTAHSPAPTLDESSVSLSYPPLEYEGAEGEVRL